MTKTIPTKKTCLKCGNNYALSSFYAHRNPLISETFGFCKKCTKKEVNLDDLDTLISFLQTMNIPYLKEFWKQANEAKTETIGTYFKNLNSLKQLQGLTFKDSDEVNGKTNQAELVEIEYKDFEVTDQVVRRWGRNLTKDDYVFLEEELQAYLSAYACETPVQMRLFQNMARTQWMANIALEDGDVNKYEKLMKTLSSQMNDASIKPVQENASANDGGLNSWGEWVKLIEETEPVDELSEDFKDTSFIKKYINRFFFVQMKRVFGLIKDEDIEKLEDED